jgi:DNA-nicking Smr family endonuclease
MKLDLHGNTVHAGWKVFTEHVAECYFSNIKTTEIITGHGKIATEIEAWVNGNRHCTEIQSHPHNTGSYYVKIRKNKLKQKPQKVNTTVDLSPLLKKFNSY